MVGFILLGGGKGNAIAGVGSGFHSGVQHLANEAEVVNGDGNVVLHLIILGADFLAQKIKEEAKKNDIPIVENKPLARMLYHNVELNEEIPEELYQMTAEVLAYVYSLKEGA